MKNGFPQVWCPALAHYIVGCFKFAGLCDSGVKPGKSHQFSGTVKFRDVTDFADDGSSCDTAYSSNGSNGGFQLFHDTSDFGFRFFYLFFNKGYLFDQRFELKGEAVFGKSNAKGTGRGSL